MTVFQVSHSVEWAVDGERTLTTIPSLLKWTSEDPVAVHICFGDASEADDVKWIMARDLLADVASGKCDRAGDGDVQVSRRTNVGLSSAYRDHLVLTLYPAQMVRVLKADLKEIKIFLDNTYIYAPLGQEIVDIDACIGKLREWGEASGV